MKSVIKKGNGGEGERLTNSSTSAYMLEWVVEEEEGGFPGCAELLSSACEEWE